MSTWAFAIVWVLAWAILGGLIIVAAETLLAQRQRRRLIESGLYPKPGTETDADVQRLMAAGHVDAAIRCHQAAHRVGYRQARDQLLPRRPAEFALLPIGLIVGVSLGLCIRNTALGVGLGLILGLCFALLMKKRRMP